MRWRVYPFAYGLWLIISIPENPAKQSNCCCGSRQKFAKLIIPHAHYETDNFWLFAAINDCVRVFQNENSRRESFQ